MPLSPAPARIAPPLEGTRSWTGTRVLVTGATGFIGAHLARRLCSLGAEVHAVSRKPREQSDHTETWHMADLTDTQATADLIRRTRPDIVFHLASAVTGARDVDIVLPTLAANLASAANLLTAVSATSGTRVVLAGSIEEPRPEKGEITPSSPYSVAKWAATGYARLFHELWNVPVSVLRVAMVYGPGQPDVSKLVPYVTLAFLRGQEPGLASGNRLVDWVYVDDVVDAFLAASATEAAGGVFDIGSGEGTSIRDVVDLLGRIVGSPLQPRYGVLADRPLESTRIADLTAAAEVLRWRPATKLQDGLRQTVAWYADRL
ncbi:UDP-glucose 4-epimerase [Planotetraspora phitsanulokensis]|uniref:UDP-glucose 4-epimerase n=1 Tax=Planotetraspora phitsanulokensis TaxID=575192 RepID=A0A8J3UF52_9ACTN|nr:NAD-dependent epimerase/dehydratase family protein [Planotetraspora phitsanulokensis]GII37860.1 UDP-glucose 4-epimerase [Planotetraspora phitsanulokensis]